MPQVYTWEQQKFDEALDGYVASLKTEKVPNALNRKAFFLTRRAMIESPKKDPYEIVRELSKTVSVTNKENQTRVVPLLWVLAAKKAARNWGGRKLDIQSKRKRAIKSGREWFRELEKKSKSITGGRKASSGFLIVGWFFSMLDIGKSVKNKSGAPYVSMTGVKKVGRPKGNADPAVPGRLSVTVTNFAESKSTAKRGGLVRAGSPGLNRAFVEETRDIVEFMAKEAEDAANEANRKLR